MNQHSGQPRAVITGLGAITPLGQSADELWEGLLAGRSGIAPFTLVDITEFPCKVSAEVKDWNPQKFIDRKAARRMGRVSQFMVAATAEAIADAKLDMEQEDRTRIGVLLGCGGGSYEDVQKGVDTIRARGPMKMDPLYFAKVPVNMPAANVALYFGLKGYNNTVTTACSSATQAIGDALTLIRTGKVDVVVAGGCEAGLTDLGLAGFCAMRALSTNSNDDPVRASRPFDAERDGFVPAEGAGALIIESEAHARARGATILAELAGFGCTNDAFHIVAPSEDGDGAARAMQLAIEDAGMAADDIDYVSAHATSTNIGDLAETMAIKTVFGERAYNIPISAAKSMLGHGIGASGAFEAVACVKTIETNTVHPTINLEHPDPGCDLDYVSEGARQVEVDAVLKNSFGFGGQNACLVLRRYEAQGD